MEGAETGLRGTFVGQLLRGGGAQSGMEGEWGAASPSTYRMQKVGGAPDQAPSQFPEKLDVLLEFIAGDPQRWPWWDSFLPFVMRKWTLSSSSWKLLRNAKVQLLEGKASEGSLPCAFKEEQSFLETWYKDREFRGSSPWAQSRFLPRQCYANLT